MAIMTSIVNTICGRCLLPTFLNVLEYTLQYAIYLALLGGASSS